MKGVVVYDSWTGNTKKIAEVIACENKFDIFKVNEAPLDLRNYDILVLGSPNIKFQPSKAAIEFMGKVFPPKQFAIFVTFGAPIWGKISSALCLKKMCSILSGKGAQCKGKFMCLGFHIKFKTYKGRPGEQEINSAKKFAKAILAV